MMAANTIYTISCYLWCPEHDVHRERPLWTGPKYPYDVCFASLQLSVWFLVHVRHVLIIAIRCFYCCNHQHHHYTMFFPRFGKTIKTIEAMFASRLCPDVPGATSRSNAFAFQWKAGEFLGWPCFMVFFMQGNTPAWISLMPLQSG